MLNTQHSNKHGNTAPSTGGVSRATFYRAHHPWSRHDPVKQPLSITTPSPACMCPCRGHASCMEARCCMLCCGHEVCALQQRAVCPLLWNAAVTSPITDAAVAIWCNLQHLMQPAKHQAQLHLWPGRVQPPPLAYPSSTTHLYVHSTHARLAASLAKCWGSLRCCTCTVHGTWP